MSRLTNLIKEALSTQPKKKDCNCGCNTCDNVGNEGILLNESKAPKMILSENLQYHVQNKLPLTENTFRYGSESFLNLWQEARYLYLREIIHVNEDDKEILSETDLGNYGMYEGEKVPLDLPMLNENVDPKTLQNEFEKEFNVRTSLIGDQKLSILIKGDIYEEFDDMVDFIESKGFKVNADLSNFEYERDYDDDRAYYPFIMFSKGLMNESEDLDWGIEKIDWKRIIDREYKEAQRIFGQAVDTKPTKEDYAAAEKYVKMKHGDKWHVEALGINKAQNKLYIQAQENLQRHLHTSSDDLLDKEYVIDRSVNESEDLDKIRKEVEKIAQNSPGKGWTKKSIDQEVNRRFQQFLNRKSMNESEDLDWEDDWEEEDDWEDDDNIYTGPYSYGIDRRTWDGDGEGLYRLEAIRKMLKKYPKELAKLESNPQYPALDMTYGELIKWYKSVSNFSLQEAKKKKKKDPPIGKPKRGGSKAYYVYVRDPKTKKVKKISFGSGGLKAKINNPKARRAFAARHKCAQKKDRTKAGYWSCRLPRYAKLLGLKSSFSGFW